MPATSPHTWAPLLGPACTSSACPPCPLHHSIAAHVRRARSRCTGPLPGLIARFRQGIRRLFRTFHRPPSAACLPRPCITTSTRTRTSAVPATALLAAASFRRAQPAETSPRPAPAWPLVPSRHSFPCPPVREPFMSPVCPPLLCHLPACRLDTPPAARRPLLPRETLARQGRRRRHPATCCFLCPDGTGTPRAAGPSCTKKKATSHFSFSPVTCKQVPSVADQSQGQE